MANLGQSLLHASSPIPPVFLPGHQSVYLINVSVAQISLVGTQGGECLHDLLIRAIDQTLSRDVSVLEIVYRVSGRTVGNTD